MLQNNYSENKNFLIGTYDSIAIFKRENVTKMTMSNNLNIEPDECMTTAVKCLQKDRINKRRVTIY